jgi:penicillin amidase
MTTMLAIEPTTPEQADALAALEAWDGDVRADSHAAALYHVWTTAIARRMLGPRLEPEVLTAYLAWRETWRCTVLPALLAEPGPWLDDDLLRDALTDAITEVAGRSWGELHRLTLAHPLAAIPGLESLFVAASIPFGGDEQTVCQAGPDGTEGYTAAVIPSWRVVWDLADPDQSRAVLPTGVSGNPASPFWADQLPIYSNGDLRPAPLSQEAIAASTVTTLTIVPA